VVTVTKLRHALALLAGFCAVAITVFVLINGVLDNLLLLTWAIFCTGVGVVAIAGDYVRSPGGIV
jgi:hypothetical protein